MISLFISFLGLKGFAGDVKPTNDWFKCDSDKDCIEIEYTCAGGVVNVSFAKQAAEFYQLENARKNCVRPKPTDAQKKIPFKVFCEMKKCRVQGINPKGPGFS